VVSVPVQPPNVYTPPFTKAIAISPKLGSSVLEPYSMAFHSGLDRIVHACQQELIKSKKHMVITFGVALETCIAHHIQPYIPHVLCTSNTQFKIFKHFCPYHIKKVWTLYS
jgi:hypothetical protein